jgi:hypothetical protein
MDTCKTSTRSRARQPKRPRKDRNCPGGQPEGVCGHSHPPSPRTPHRDAPNTIGGEFHAFIYDHALPWSFNHFRCCGSLSARARRRLLPSWESRSRPQPVRAADLCRWRLMTEFEGSPSRVEIAAGSHPVKSLLMHPRRQTRSAPCLRRPPRRWRSGLPLPCRQRGR